jgi:entericidin B
MKTTRVVTFMLIGLLVVLSGCNTMRGVGEDVEKAGEAIQRKSSK